MSPKVQVSPFAAAALALAVWSICAPRAGAVTSSEMSGDRYRVILEKEPFGPPPPKGPTPEELEAARRAAEEAAKAAEPETPAYVIPPGLEKVKVTLLSRYRGTKAVGFMDGESGKPYFLFEGQEFDGFECRAVDLENRMVTLAKSGLEADLPLWINPATTNCADVTTFGQPGGRPVDLSTLQTKTKWEIEQERAEAKKRLDEKRAAREERRREMEERRKQHAEEMAALTPEEREQRMHDIAVDIIVNESGPPLPVELNERDLDRLEEEGFEVGAAREAMAERPRGPRRPGGFRGPPPPGGDDEEE
ncbi:MAG: hypothetical protein IJL06_00520 [Kiritimatiellae bacterium]|nr:hypothetical protein [Kiritimatiellia bacterium]